MKFDFIQNSDVSFICKLNFQVQSRYEERQQALLQLLQLEGQPLIDDQEEEKLLNQAHSAGL
jgi:hypothetical protein